MFKRNAWSDTRIATARRRSVGAPLGADSAVSTLATQVLLLAA
jgi:hypothetical protein